MNDYILKNEDIIQKNDLFLRENEWVKVQLTIGMTVKEAKEKYIDIIKFKRSYTKPIYKPFNLRDR